MEKGEIMPPWDNYQKSTQEAPSGPWAKYQSAAVPDEPVVAGIDAPQPFMDAYKSNVGGYKNQVKDQFTKPYQQDASPGPDWLQRVGDAGGRVANVAAGLVGGTLMAPVEAGIETKVTQPIARALMPQNATYEQKQKAARVAKDTSDVATIALMAPRALKTANSPATLAEIPQNARAVANKVSSLEASSQKLPSILGDVSSQGKLPSVIPRADEGLRDVGLLAQKYGIPISMDQISSSPALKNTQKISQEIPFSGQAGFREKQMASFNSALLKTVGGEGEKFTPIVMDKLFINVGRKFDKLGAGKKFKLDNDFAKNIEAIREEANSISNRDAIANFEHELDVILKEQREGVISGEQLGKIRSRINERARKAGNADTQALLHDLENAVIDVMTAGDDVARGKLSLAKQQYKNLLVIEPLVNKSKGGNLSPALLQQRVAQIYKRQFTRGKAGEIGDLARIGHELLPVLGGSDTMQKGAYLVGALNAVTNPASIPLMAGGVAANRAYQGINRSQTLVRKALKAPPKP